MMVGDITKDESIKKLVEYIKTKFGKLDIQVNNACCSPIKPLKELKIEDYDKTFDLNARALVNVTIECLPLIIKSKGNILNISTVGATDHWPNYSMYVGSNASVENFTRCWALELAKDGVRVNGIAPGQKETKLWNIPNLFPEYIKNAKESVIKTIPLGRFGKPEEIANVALFLVSNEASFIT